MNLTGFIPDTTTVLSMGLMIITAYAAIWSIRKVISLAKYDDPNDPGNYDHDVFSEYSDHESTGIFDGYDDSDHVGSSVFDDDREYVDIEGRFYYQDDSGEWIEKERVY